MPVVFRGKTIFATGRKAANGVILHDALSSIGNDNFSGTDQERAFEVVACEEAGSDLLLTLYEGLAQRLLVYRFDGETGRLSLLRVRTNIEQPADLLPWWTATSLTDDAPALTQLLDPRAHRT